VSKEIALIPKLPEQIVRAVDDDKLAVFIGAGVSRLVGCVGWGDLGKSLVNRCYEKGVIIYKEREALSEIADSKKVITICHGLLTEKGLEGIFFDEMKAALRDDLNVATPNIYDDIYRLRGVFVTSNADRHFHRCFNPENRFYRPEEVRPDNIDRLNLYHIHGCIEKPDTMVFTLRQYFERYQQGQFEEFLKRIFAEYTILFLGYGLGEFELLDFLFQQFEERATRVLRHFMLKPLYSGEERILKFEQSYYGQMGIRVLPYRKDERGYKQLEHVVRDWNRRLSRVSTYLHSSFEEIDRLIEA
jgi:hypothetical protein